MSVLEILILILVIAWLMGGVIVPVGGNAIHLLLVIVLVLVIVRILQGRTVL